MPSVPVLAWRFPCAGVFCMRVRMVPSTPAMGSDWKNKSKLGDRRMTSRMLTIVAGEMRSSRDKPLPSRTM